MRAAEAYLPSMDWLSSLESRLVELLSANVTVEVFDATNTICVPPGQAILPSMVMVCVPPT